MAPRNFGRDANGKFIGPESLLRVKPSQGAKYKAWVVKYDADEDLLTLQDAKRAFVRHAKPNQCKVIRPTDMDKIKRQAQEESIHYVSESLIRKKLKRKE